MVTSFYNDDDDSDAPQAWGWVESPRAINRPLAGKFLSAGDEGYAAVGGRYVHVTCW